MSNNPYYYRKVEIMCYVLNETSGNQNYVHSSHCMKKYGVGIKLILMFNVIQWVTQWLQRTIIIIGVNMERTLIIQSFLQPNPLNL